MILVTGAAGFVGRCLVRRLLADDRPVRVLVHSPRGADTLHAALPAGADPEIVAGDVLEHQTVSSATSGCDAVLHLAGRYRGRPDELWAVHRHGTANLLAAVGDAARVVLLSSTSVYGWERAWPADERTPPRPVTAYGRAKIAAERLVRSLPDGRGVVVRSTIVYGPGDRRGMLTRAHHLLARGVRWVPGDGRNRIHLTHVDDVVDALVRAADGGEGTYQVAGPQATPVGEVLDVLARAARVPAPVFVGAAPLARLAGRVAELGWDLLGRDGQPPLTAHAVDVVTRDRAFAADRAQRELGWRPQVTLHDGLDDTGRWLAEHLAPARARRSEQPTRWRRSGAVETPPVAHQVRQAPAGSGVTGSDDGAGCALGPAWRDYFRDPDEGLGTVYERFVLADVIDRALHLTGSASLLHAPLFGMTGIPGLDAVFAARRGIQVGLADTCRQRLEHVEGMWHELGLTPATHHLDADPASWPQELDGTYDLVFSFAALWWFDDPWAALAAQARYARRGVLVAVPNRTVFLEVRRRTWHRDLFDRLNLDALDLDRIVAAGRHAGLEPAGDGQFDLPPFPDTAVPVARLLRRGSSDGARWTWSILPYLRGDAPDLPDRIRWVGAVERRAPPALARHLAHHRHVLLVPADRQRAATAAS